jgi:hypothetical protein
VNPHSLFLRKGCILPNQLDPLHQPIDDDWTVVQDIGAPFFDTVIRQAGWHFMWIQDSCAGRGFGRTAKSATVRALSHALRGIAREFNAAELDSVQLAKFAGFYAATAILQARQIQQETLLAVPNENPTRS